MALGQDIYNGEGQLILGKHLVYSGEKLALGGVEQLSVGGAASLVTTSAILSTLSKALTEFLLQDDKEEEDDE